MLLDESIKPLDKSWRVVVNEKDQRTFFHLRDTMVEEWFRLFFNFPNLGQEVAQSEEVGAKEFLVALPCARVGYVQLLKDWINL